MSSGALAMTVDFPQLGTITPYYCYSCQSSPCRCWNVALGSAACTTWPVLPPVIDHDLLATKVAEKLLAALDPKAAKQRAKDAAEHQELVSRLRKALEALETT